MKSRTNLRIGAALVMFSGLTSTYGNHLINDDFEANEINSDPTGWTVTEKTDEKGTDSVSVVKLNAQGTTGSKAVQIIKASKITTSPEVRNTFDPGSKNLSIEFDYMFTDPGASPNLRLMAGNHAVVNLRMTTGRNSAAAYTQDGATWRELDSSLAANTWYHFKLDLSGSTLTIHVTGGRRVKDRLSDVNMKAGFDASSIDKIMFRFSSGAATGNYTIDNVTITGQ